MKFTVHVKPNARHEKVEPQSDGSLKVYVNAPPQEGRANAALAAALARHFGVPKSRVSVVRGVAGRRKIIEIV